MSDFQNRYIFNQIISDLENKMVFIGGPRQVGKTTLAKKISPNKESYLNWDNDEHRTKILSKELPNSNIWVFDEIHKYKKWRNFLKGIYDVKEDKQKILVTGSARLDLYRRGGDSLQGRYHFLRLYPFSVKELNLKTLIDLNNLIKFGGFPEPFLKGSASFSKRWSREYRIRLVREEIVGLEQVKDISLIELLNNRLPDLVASQLSVNNLAQDLQVSYQTIANWLQILEKLYSCFRISPFGSPILKALKKEQKIYLYDWSSIDEEGPKFENFIALHLLKWVHFNQDVYGEDLQLRYFRDREKREVDFVVCKKNTPVMFIEAKLNDTKISEHLKYLKRKFKEVKCLQVVLNPKKTYKSPEGIEVVSALDFLNELI